MKQKAKKARLQRRIAAWNAMPSARADSAARSRYQAGGYKCPGSTRR